MSDAPELISLDQAQAPFVFGVDVGGTGIKIGLVDDRGRTLGWQRIETLAEQGPDAAVARIQGALDKVAREAKVDDGDILAVGLATPGTMDIPAGMFLNPVNLPGWQNYPIRDKVARLTPDFSASSSSGQSRARRSSAIRRPISCSRLLITIPIFEIFLINGNRHFAK